MLKNKWKKVTAPGIQDKGHPKGFFKNKREIEMK